jgi:hypothetical protein
MGYFDFTSQPARDFWRVTSGLFPKGKWTDPRGIESGYADWWSKAFEDLLKAANNFRDAPVLGLRYDERGAQTAKEEILTLLKLWSDPNGVVSRQNIVGALKNEISSLLRALPDLDRLAALPNLREGVAEAIESFNNHSFTTLKYLAGGLESEARRQSADPAANWQTDGNTLSLLKFKEVAETISDGIGRLPDELRMYGADTPHLYFDFMIGNLRDLDRASPVPSTLLKETVAKLGGFDNDIKTPTDRVKALLTVDAATGMLEMMGSKLVSGEPAVADDRTKTACETMAWLESLSDFLGEGRAGNKTHFGKGPSEREQREFEALAKFGLERIDRTRWEERWERPRK